MTKKVEKVSPVLSAETAEALEKQLRNDIDAWGFQVESQIQPANDSCEIQSWIKRGRPGIKRKVATITRNIVNNLSSSFKRSRQSKKT